MSTADEIANGVALEMSKRDARHRERLNAKMLRWKYVGSAVAAIFGGLQIAQLVLK